MDAGREAVPVENTRLDGRRCFDQERHSSCQGDQTLLARGGIVVRVSRTVVWVRQRHAGEL